MSRLGVLICTYMGTQPGGTEMSDAWSFVEIAGLRVELLPARTVLSLFSADGNGPVIADACQTTHSAAMPAVLGLLGGSPEQQSVMCQPAVIVSGGGPAVTGGGSAVTGGESAVTGGESGVTDGGSAAEATS